VGIATRDFVRHRRSYETAKRKTEEDRRKLGKSLDILRKDVRGATGQVRGEEKGQGVQVHMGRKEKKEGDAVLRQEISMPEKKRIRRFGGAVWEERERLSS